MKLRSSKRFPALLALLLLSLPSAAQQPLPSGAQTPDGLALLSLSELVLDRYPVQHVSANDLANLARTLIGREYYVKENGATGSKPVSSLRLLGNTIVLYDTKEQVQRARELLARLDATHEEDVRSYKAVEYRPRFVSLKTATNAVENLVDLSVVPDRGLIVMTDDQGDIDAALALLARIDVAEKQVLLTCQLIEVGDSAHGLALPRDLTDNLQKLLPGSAFTQVGMAMLKTSVSSQSPVSVQIESPGKRYQLSFIPVAFDQATSTLTISECSLTEAAEQGPRSLFTTNTVLRGGEYTVLAATGATPRLLVVRVTPQG
ncbi:MAG: hypothetical protein HOP15_10810 [Planctomycetes bacterium]|nr:hypothetical protein [Planctomycetota bacterium]